MLLNRLSHYLLNIEVFLLKCLMGGVLGLILLNVITRSMSNAIYWIDEAAIYCMIWMVFVGTSVGIRKRERIAVTLLIDTVPPKVKFYMDMFIDAVVVAFGAFFIWVTWIWYDPIELYRAGFDFEIFSEETFNFIYQEPTNTIGVQKFWVWLIIPYFSLSILIHGLMNIIETLFHKQKLVAHSITEGLD